MWIEDNELFISILWSPVLYILRRPGLRTSGGPSSLGAGERGPRALLLISSIPWSQASLVAGAFFPRAALATQCTASEWPWEMQLNCRFLRAELISLYLLVSIQKETDTYSGWVKEDLFTRGLIIRVWVGNRESTGPSAGAQGQQQQHCHNPRP